MWINRNTSCSPVVVLCSSIQTGEERAVRRSGTVFWVGQGLAHGAPALLKGTSLLVMRMANMRQCSANDGQDTAGVWTETGFRSRGLIQNPAGAPCVSYWSSF